MTVAATTALPPGVAAVGKGRLRGSILVDLTVCVASFLSIDLGLQAFSHAFLSNAVGPHLLRDWGYWIALLDYAPWLAFGGAWLALIACFARNGQTIGLAVFRLRWQARDTRDARRRLLGEPQFWCAALPALSSLLLACIALVESIVPGVAWRVWHVAVFVQIDGPLFTCGVIACTLAILLASRRHPARLVSWA